MSDIIARDAKSGRFLAGNGGGGRKPGSRNKLSEAFLSDVEASWRQHGAEVLDRVAREEPGVYLRAIVALMPREATLDVSIDVHDQVVELLETFRQANNGRVDQSLERMARRLLPKVLNVDPE
ncbi:hypothetical protein [Bradyrhizobium sp. SZCCHNRI1002]|uniref:hypothetical protein n=1 Tax=Bradyrhizobium sp. SZCCHNRI1002 TaxID=3057274 RepID=UPI0028E33F9A|nr:hypothetical protein [Bradyrhizobium sp. SZCCHNRI1002]